MTVQLRITLLVIAAKYSLAEAYTDRGRAYSRITNYDEAMSDYGQAIQADQKYWEAYEHRALTELKMGSITGCIAGFSKGSGN